MRTLHHSLAAVLTARATLALFTVLTAGWFLPGLLGPYAGAALPLYLPAYLVSMVTYDGVLGLEQAVYAVQNAVSGEWAGAWDAGLAVTFYLFSVVVARLSRPLERRFGPESEESGRQSTNRPSVRYTAAAGLLLVGLLLIAQGVVVQPTMTGVSCSGAASDGAGATATPECTRTTEPATGAQLYMFGLGVATGLLGAGVVAADRRLAAQR
ncbi:MAG: hypothetical protein V5A56_00685 [Halolamina sp.]